MKSTELEAGVATPEQSSLIDFECAAVTCWEWRSTTSPIELTGHDGCRMRPVLSPWEATVGFNLIDEKRSIVYDRILIPTDGSDAAVEASKHALDLAERHDADLDVLYVVDHERLGRMAPQLSTNQIREALAAEGERATSMVADKADQAGIDVKTVVREGIPADTIVEYAGEESIDVIVMGTTGRSGLDRLLLGSVAETVIQRTEMPVFLVKQTSNELGDVDEGEGENEAEDADA
ncbi:MAG: universal stress protein [Halobacteriota archaeon]